MLSLVVTSGTGKAAQVGDEFIWGKTGTTENYGDAWFVGGNDDITVAIWVGYADKLQPMEYEHAGGPVAGGTYPRRDLPRLHVVLARAARAAPTRARPNRDDGDDRRASRRPSRSPRRTSRPPSRPRPPSPRPDDERTDEAAPTEDSPAPQDQAPEQPAPNARARAHRRPAQRRRRGRRGEPGRNRRLGRRAPSASRPATAARRGASRRRRSATGRSAAFVMPIRSPITTRGSREPGSRVSTSIGPSTSELPFSERPIAERLGELSGARAEVLVLAPRRGARA